MYAVAVATTFSTPFSVPTDWSRYETMSTSTISDLPPDGPLYGALYFGVVMSTAFYGVTCMQT